MGDRAGVCPSSDVRFQPCHRVLAQPPSLREPAGELEAVDGHPRETGELHYLSDAKEFHSGISCDLPFRGAPFADVRGQSLIRFSGKVIPRSCVFCPNTSYSFRRVMVEGHQYSGWFPRSARCSSMGQPKRTPLERPLTRLCRILGPSVRRGVDRYCPLVYRLNVVRESRGRYRAITLRHVLWHSAR